MKTFSFYYNYKDFTLHLIADSLSLKSINFCGKKKSSTIDNKTPYPLIMAHHWLNSYFSIAGSDFPDVELSAPLNLKQENSYADNKRGKILLDLSSYTEKEIQVYKELVKIEPGRRISYGALAEKSGIPSGARFIGNTMAKNRFPVIIPCHRVIKSDSSMGNYTGGIHIKKFLLDHESRA